MAAYKIFFKKSVQKDLSFIPKKDLKKILSRIEDMGEDPRSAGCEKLTGQRSGGETLMEYRCSSSTIRAGHPMPGLHNA